MGMVSKFVNTVHVLRKDLFSYLYNKFARGQSFHFAYKLKGETFQSSIARHEYYLAGRLGVRSGDKVLDCGCGIGGPMRNIAKFTRANIRGVTLNEVNL